jgi:hypothetical protein
MWRRAWAGGAHCPSTARHDAFNDQIFVVSYRPYVSETGTVFESLQIGETCTNLRPPPWTTLGRAPRLRWGGYGVTKSLKVLRDKLGHHNFLFGHAIRL